MSKIGIKFIQGGKVYNVDTDLDLQIDEKVVLETIRGLEIGIVCKPSADDGQEEVKKLMVSIGELK